MAISDLVRALETEAAERTLAVREDALREAAALRDQAALSDAAALEGELERYRARVQATADAGVSAAARVRRNTVLEARAAALESLRGAVEKALPELFDQPDGPALFDALVDLALSARGTGAAVLRAPPRWVERARARASGADVVSDGEVGSGVLLEEDGGRVAVEATLEALLDRFWPRLRIAALEDAP